jgi:hypothetical protein
MTEAQTKHTTQNVDGVRTSQSALQRTTSTQARSSTGSVAHTPEQTGTVPPRTARQDARRARIQQGGRMARGQEAMRQGAQQRGVPYRIKGMSKFAMLTVALMLDLLPLIAIIAIVGLVMGQFGLNADTLKACADSAQKGFWFGNTYNHIHCTLGGGLALLMGGATLFWLGPAIYLVTSFLTVLMAPLIFFAWFTVKKVPYFSSKGGRMQVMLFSFIVESIPFINIVPCITFSTWKQISISRKEDRVTLVA